jgi:hypothetical protein
MAMTPIQKLLGATVALAAGAVGLNLLVGEPHRGAGPGADGPAAGAGVASEDGAGAAPGIVRPGAAAGDDQRFMPLVPRAGMSKQEWLRINRELLAGVDGEIADERPARPDNVLSTEDFVAADEAAFTQVVDSLNNTRDDRLPAVGRCNSLWAARGVRGVAGGRFELYLSFSSVGGKGRIIDVDGSWPEGFDEELKDCYRQAYVGHEFATDHDYAYTYVWPVCAPGDDVRDDGEHPELPIQTIMHFPS